MTYKDIAVKREQQLKAENDDLRRVLQQTSDKCIRYKVLLYNAIVILQENDIDLNRELGITGKEYKEVMEQCTQ